jgi:hypothetical protein
MKIGFRIPSIKKRIAARTPVKRLTNTEGQACECGGHLDRDKVVFCPTCKSTNMGL